MEAHYQPVTTRIRLPPAQNRKATFGEGPLVHPDVARADVMIGLFTSKGEPMKVLSNGEEGIIPITPIDKVRQATKQWVVCMYTCAFGVWLRV